jgi:hypothetical protein
VALELRVWAARAAHRVSGQRQKPRPPSAGASAIAGGDSPTPLARWATSVSASLSVVIIFGVKIGEDRTYPPASRVLFPSPPRARPARLRFSEPARARGRDAALTEGRGDAISRARLTVLAPSNACRLGAMAAEEGVHGHRRERAPRGLAFVKLPSVYPSPVGVTTVLPFRPRRGGGEPPRGRPKRPT